MLVSAIMPTRNRPAMAMEAVEAWKRQTYRPTELIILDDPTAPSFPDGIDGRGISYWRMDEKPLGTKRNTLCELAKGEVIVHWDDDDVSTPGRIADQVARMLATGAAVTGYHAMRFHDGEKWFKYTGSEFYALGTSLMYRKWFWERNQFFPSADGCSINEDNLFVARANSCIVTADAGEMMYARIHAAHTSAKKVFKEDGEFAGNWSAA